VSTIYLTFSIFRIFAAFYFMSYSLDRPQMLPKITGKSIAVPQDLGVKASGSMVNI
jgi:hypothetical protein